MSYDHKPCQLKEKKRIQEAGGFVAMNGVWRVMGVLATSRALGDYPLKVMIVVTDASASYAMFARIRKLLFLNLMFFHSVSRIIKWSWQVRYSYFFS